MPMQQLFPKPIPRLPGYADTDIRNYDPMDPWKDNPWQQMVRGGAKVNKSMTAGPNELEPVTIQAPTRPRADLTRLASVAAPNTPLQGRAPAFSVSAPSPVIPGTAAAKKKAGFKDIAPYVSNIANMFAQPALPPAPSYLDQVNFDRVSMDGDRALVEQQGRGVDLASERLLDGNNAVAAKIGGFTQRVKSLTDINGRERNQNIEISNREKQLNAGIDARNLAAGDQFKREQVDLSNVMASNRSGNLADLMDKFVGKNNQDALAQLDKDKLKVLSKMSPDVWKRMMGKLKAEGLNVED